MVFFKSFKKRFFLFLMVCIMVIYSGYLFTLLSLPGQITMLEGQEYSVSFKNPFFVNVKIDKEGILSINNQEIKASGNIIKLSNPVKFKTSSNGRVNMYLKLFGLLPLKTLRVDVLKNHKIIACGNTVGVKLKTDGVLVVGMSDVVTDENKRVLPSRSSNIRPGDIIFQVNQSRVNDISDLIKEIENSHGNAIALKYRRGSRIEQAQIVPVKSADDSKYHIGLWVRDSTAGIGTLTFYDPSSKRFGALGHGITDIDTGMLMPIKSGELLGSNILAVKKSERGFPGELKGIFAEGNKLGTISVNSELGIYGKLNNGAAGSINGNMYTVALRTEVKEGPAYILSNIDGKTVEEYKVEIQRVSRQNTNGSKGMVIKVTDERLLDTTGGIVQGMSGSPIIQNGKIVGAVTHVLVNDPTRGYGIFIEGMLKHIEKSNISNESTDLAG